jgi:hypothetical protein
MEPLSHASLFGLLTMVLALAPVVSALAYVWRPSERRLALMRPVSLAGLFAALAGTVLGFLTWLRGIAATPDVFQGRHHLAMIGLAESLVPLLVGFASLTVAWLLVAAGMSRRPAG